MHAYPQSHNYGAKTKLLQSRSIYDNGNNEKTLLAMEFIKDSEQRDSRGKTRRWMKRRELLFQYHNKGIKFRRFRGFQRNDAYAERRFLYTTQYTEIDITPKQILDGIPVINAKARLALTLRFLSTGDTYRSSFQFRISKYHISCDSRFKLLPLFPQQTHRTLLLFHYGPVPSFPSNGTPYQSIPKKGPAFIT